MPGGLLDAYKIQFANSSLASTNTTTTTTTPTSPHQPRRRVVRPRPSPRTQRIAGASAEALRLSSQESREYDQWLIQQYTNYGNNTATSPPTSPPHSSRHTTKKNDNNDLTTLPYDPANSPVHLRAYSQQRLQQQERVQQHQQRQQQQQRQHHHQHHHHHQQQLRHRDLTPSSTPVSLTSFAHHHDPLTVQPWEQDNNTTTRSHASSEGPSRQSSLRSKDPDRFGHQHAKWYNDLKTNTQVWTDNSNQNNANHTKGLPHALVPNSKAKQQVLTIVSESVLQRKKTFNGLVLKRAELKRTRDMLNAKFLDKLNIRFRGLAFEVLPFEEALGIQSVVDHRLHRYFHQKLQQYLFDLDGEQDITALVDEVDHAFHTINVIRPVSSELVTLFRAPDTTAETVFLNFRRKLIENRIKYETRYTNQLIYMFKRKEEENRVLNDNMATLNDAVLKATEQCEEVRLSYQTAKKNILQKVKEASKLKKTLYNVETLHEKMLEKSQRQVNDDRQWQQELEKIQQETTMVAKKAAAQSRSSAMKIISKVHVRKKTLLMAEKMYQDQRLGPYKDAADKIFKATGVDSVEKILATFQDQSKKEMIMKELTEEKEIEKHDKSMLLKRLRKVLQRGMVAGVHVQQSDGNIESVEASLDHASKHLQVATERVVTKEKLTNSCKAGVLSLCFKVGIKENNERNLLETLDQLEHELVRILQASYKTVGQDTFDVHRRRSSSGPMANRLGTALTTSESNASMAAAAKVNLEHHPSVAVPVVPVVPVIPVPVAAAAAAAAQVEHRAEAPQEHHHPYETVLRKQMIAMHGSPTSLKSPCDSPNNIRISPTKKKLSMNAKLLVANLNGVNGFDLNKTQVGGNNDSDGEEDEAANDELLCLDGEEDVLDVLPHLLTPNELEGFLKETMDGCNTGARGARGAARRQAKNATNKLDKYKSGTIGAGITLTSATSLAEMGKEGMAAGKRFLRRHTTQQGGTEQLPPPPPPPPKEQQDWSRSLRGNGKRDVLDVLDEDLIEHRRVQKWSTTTIVEAYRKKLKTLYREAQVAKAEGRFDDAQFIEKTPIPKLKTRTHTHQLMALHEALVAQKEKEKKHHHKKHHHHHHKHK